MNGLADHGTPVWFAGGKTAIPAQTQTDDMPISDGYMMLDNPHAGYALIPTDKLEEWHAWLALAYDSTSSDASRAAREDPPGWAETLDFGMLSYAVTVPSYEIPTIGRIGPPVPNGYAIVGNEPDTDVFIIPADNLGDWQEMLGYGDDSEREALREEFDVPEWAFNVSSGTSDWAIHFPDYEIE
jgi:hypothetical protein